MPDSYTINVKDRFLIDALRTMTGSKRGTVAISPEDCASIVAVIDGLSETIDKLHAALRDSEKCREDNAEERNSLRCEMDRLRTKNDALARDLEEAEKTVQLLTDELAELRSRPPVIAAPVGSLVPTGEVRSPKIGEWFGYDLVMRSKTNYHSSLTMPIYRRVEPGEHGEYTHVLRLVGRDIPPKAGQLWCNNQANTRLCDLTMTSSDFTGPMRWVYELVPLTPAAPDEPDNGFSAWWSGLEPDQGEPRLRCVNGKHTVFEDEARAIWKAARKAQSPSSPSPERTDR